MTRGRPRSFDRQQALQSARDVFWSLGFEGTTLLDLQSAMGNIAAPSFYAAFGSKEQLFRDVVALYAETDGRPVLDALATGPTARESVHAMLQAAARTFSRRDKPRGCLLVVGAINCAQASKGVEDFLRERRLHTKRVIRERLERGQAEGDLAHTHDVDALAAFYATVLHGISIQARDGATRKALTAAAELAMAAWPNDARTRARRT